MDELVALVPRVVHVAVGKHVQTRRQFNHLHSIAAVDDRGNSWRAVSPDLTRQLDRNKLEVMGRFSAISRALRLL